MSMSGWSLAGKTARLAAWLTAQALGSASLMTGRVTSASKLVAITAVMIARVTTVSVLKRFHDSRDPPGR